MKVIENVRLVMMTVEEVTENVVFDKANRNHQRNSNGDGTLCYSKASCRKTNSRINKYKKMLTKAGKWKICSPMIVHEINNVKYISEGQGRYEAVLELNSESTKGNVISEIPVMIITCQTIEEMRDDTRDMNNFNVNWNAEDRYRSLAVSKGGESAEIYDLIRKYQDTLDVDSNYIPRLIIFGQAGSHRDNVSEMIKDNVSPFSEYFFNIFKKFYEMQSDRTPKQIKKIKTTSVAIALDSLLRNIIRACNTDKNIYISRVEKAISILSNYLHDCNDNEYIRKLNGKDVDIKLSFYDILNKKTKDEKIRNGIGMMVGHMGYSVKHLAA